MAGSPKIRTASTSESENRAGSVPVEHERHRSNARSASDYPAKPSTMALRPISAPWAHDDSPRRHDHPTPVLARRHARRPCRDGARRLARRRCRRSTAGGRRCEPDRRRRAGLVAGRQDDRLREPPEPTAATPGRSTPSRRQAAPAARSRTAPSTASTSPGRPTGRRSPSRASPAGRSSRPATSMSMNASGGSRARLERRRRLRRAVRLVARRDDARVRPDHRRDRLDLHDERRRHDLHELTPSQSTTTTGASGRRTARRSPSTAPARARSATSG